MELDVDKVLEIQERARCLLKEHPDQFQVERYDRDGGSEMSATTTLRFPSRDARFRLSSVRCLLTLFASVGQQEEGVVDGQVSLSGDHLGQYVVTWTNADMRWSPAEWSGAVEEERLLCGRLNFYRGAQSTMEDSGASWLVDRAVECQFPTRYIKGVGDMPLEGESYAEVVGRDGEKGSEMVAFETFFG